MKPSTPASLILLATLAGASACSYRPARFADTPPVSEVADDAPIPVPRRFTPLHAIYMAEAYVRRPIVDALDPTRVPDAGDVNAFDEVPRSSWFDPRAAAAPVQPGPVLPLTVLQAPPVSGRDGIAVSDARGVHWELRRDFASRPQMHSGVGAVASRLLRAIGYLTPDVWVTDIAPEDLLVPPGTDTAVADFLREGPPPVMKDRKDRRARPRASLAAAAAGRYRVSALRWPLGVDIGTTHVAETRDDDPNDRVSHLDRRTLRAIAPALFWVGITWLEPGALRDVYFGDPGKGHVRHYIVGLDGALGADAVDDPVATSEFAGENGLVILGTLGLDPKRRTPVQTHWMAIGDYPLDASPAGFSTRPPFDPVDRMLSADLYWMAKRIAKVPRDAIVSAVAAGKFSEAATRERAFDVLWARRRAVLEYGYKFVTPCEVEGVQGGLLMLRDEAIAAGIERSENASYSIRFLDDEGEEIAKRVEASAQGARVSVALPETTVPYMVVQVVVTRSGKVAPRGFEAHFARGSGGMRVVGVRH